MTTQEVYRSLEEIIEAEPGSLTGPESLSDLNGWDSLAVLGFIAMADSKLALSIPAKAITGCKTVKELVGLLGDKVGD